MTRRWTAVYAFGLACIVVAGVGSVLHGDWLAGVAWTVACFAFGSAWAWHRTTERERQSRCTTNVAVFVPPDAGIDERELANRLDDIVRKGPPGGYPTG